MKERYFKMNQYDPEAVNLRKRIYDWCKKRETVVQARYIQIFLIVMIHQQI